MVRLGSVLACVLFVSYSPGLIRAGGELHFSNPEPRTRETVRVTYRPAPALSGADRVVLRARYRTIHSNPHSAPPSSEGFTVITIAELKRGRDGTFTGSWTLPDSALHAAFAVENSDASYVDDNAGRFWEVLRHEADGRPSVEALHQRLGNQLGDNWVEARQTTLRMTELHPDDARAWRARWLYEGLLRSDQTRDSVGKFFSAKLRELDARFTRDTALGRIQLPYMASFANTLQQDGAVPADSAIVNKWVTRALREAPTSPSVLDMRGFRIFLGMRNDPVAALRDLEALWAEGGDSLNIAREGQQVRHQFTRAGYRVAVMARDSAAVVRWAERTAAGGRYARRGSGKYILRSYPVTRPVVMDWLRAELRILDDMRPEHRMLGETVAEQRRRHAQEARDLMGVLGMALVASGHTRAALDTLALATADGWELDVFRDVVQARLAARDSVHALEVLAMISSDPRTTAAYRDSVSALASNLVGIERWHDMLAQGKAELTRRVMSMAVTREPTRVIRLQDETGRTHTLSDLTGGNIAFVFLWTRACAYSMQDLALADSIATRLAASGVRVLSVSDDPRSPEVAELIRSKKLLQPVYYNAYKDLMPAFNLHAWPSYLVLDGSGRLRFRTGSPPDRVLVQIAALRDN